MPFILALVVAIIYFLAAFLFWRVYKNKLNGLLPVALMALASLFHSFLLFLEVRRGNFIDLSIFKVISIYGWVMALFALMFFWRSALALAAMAIAIFNGLIVPLPHIFISTKAFSGNLSGGMLWHILFSIGAWTLLTMAFLHACLYSWLFHQLKQKQLRQVPPLSLAGLEKAMMQLTLGGFILLSLSLISGGLFVENLWAQHLVHKSLLTLLAWLALAVLLFYFYGQKIRAMQLVYGLLAICALLLAGYVISNIILQFFILGN